MEPVEPIQGRIHGPLDQEPSTPGPKQIRPDEDLRDDLAPNPEDVPIPDWQMAEVERRKANLEQNPGSSLSWEEVVRSIKARHRR